MTADLHLGVALDGFGWHRRAWQHAAGSALSGRYWADLATTAERGLLDFLTIDDDLTPQPGRRESLSPGRLAGRADAVLVADRVSSTAHEAALFGRRDSFDPSELFTQATEFVDVCGGEHLRVYADVVVTFGGDTDFGSDAVIISAGPAEVAELIIRWHELGADGVRLRPAVNATDLPVCFESLPRRFALNVPLSILDLSPISAGSDAATALRNTVNLAQHAERWGYRRFWIAEHHFVAVASSSPGVLIGQLAAATKTIHVGAAAVQLGNTTAVAVAESFGMLDAFYPGRIDLGVGRSGQKRTEAQRDSAPRPPKTPRPERVWHEVDGVVVPTPFDVSALTRSARLRAQSAVLKQPEALTPDFAEQVRDIIELFDGTFSVNDVDVPLVPGEGSALVPWVFGSSRGQSARVAGALGLPFVASYHITPATAMEAVEAYRAAFRPSKWLADPYVVASADVVVAEDTATAQHLASSYGQWVYSIRAQGGATPYPDPDECKPLTDEQIELVKDCTATQFVGNPDEVVARLAALQRVTGADELVITSVTHGHEDRLRSHELLARSWLGDGDHAGR